MLGARGGARPRLGHQLGRSGCHVEDGAATKACCSRLDCRIGFLGLQKSWASKKTHIP